MRRLAKQTDIDEVYDIYMEDSIIPFLGYDPMPKQEFLTVFSSLTKDKTFFVYELEGKVIGFYKTTRYPGRCNHVAYIGSLAINPEYQGRGLAKAMMKEVIDELQSNGIKRIELIVESDNPKAIRFYERLGFKIEGTLQKFYKRAREDCYIDDHIMALLLD